MREIIGTCAKGSSHCNKLLATEQPQDGFFCPDVCAVH
jgi:hypothetical protein